MKNLRKKLFEIIFEADTRAGKYFDISLLIIILLSVFIVLLESVPELRHNHGLFLTRIEWIFTGIFSLEYFLRILVSYKKLRYIFSFYGIIDLLSILPAFLATIISGAHSLIIIRVFRLLRVFRIFKVSRYTNAGQTLVNALMASRAKIGVFFFAVMTVVLMVGTIMYLIEGEANGFDSIPRSIYWAIVTLTTVGFGDITPQTTLGQFLSSVVMLLGYAIIAVPTGIISVEIARAGSTNTQVCPSCYNDKHDDNAKYCNRCGAELNP